MIYFGYTERGEKTMTATISKWGNSNGLRLSKEIMERLGLAAGDKVKLGIVDGKLIIEPLERTCYDIRELVKEIPGDYEAMEFFDDREGREIW
jgi:antitoxin MazE